jgi:hypothetical protein
MEQPTVDLVMERSSEEIHEPEFAAYAPLVSFEAFLAERRVYGWVRLTADRLTDLVATHDSVRLVNVLIELLADRRTVTAEEATLRRSELVAVVASGPRGEPSRRLATVTHRVLVQSGPYVIGGDLHAPPDVDPLDRVRDGGPMVPLTDAWLEHGWGGEVRRERLETIIVNRELVTRLELIGDPAT